MTAPSLPCLSPISALAGVHLRGGSIAATDEQLRGELHLLDHSRRTEKARHPQRGATSLSSDSPSYRGQSARE